jgi:hypothetical protein
VPDSIPSKFLKKLDAMSTTIPSKHAADNQRSMLDIGGNPKKFAINSSKIFRMLLTL